MARRETARIAPSKPPRIKVVDARLRSTKSGGIKAFLTLEDGSEAVVPSWGMEQIVVTYIEANNELAAAEAEMEASAPETVKH